MAQSQAKRIEELKEWHRDAAAANSDWRGRAIESYQFYTGIRQWKPEWEEELRKAGRPMLKINRIWGLVNMVSGHQRQNRRQTRLYPRRGGTVAIAALGSELIKHTLDVCDGYYNLSDMFTDGLVTGKGWAFLDHSFRDDLIQGDLVLEKMSPFAIIEDQANRDYDVDRCKFIFRRFWWDKQQVELQYPGRGRELQNAIASPDWEGSVRTEDDLDYGEGDGEDVATHAGRKKRQYEIRECWYKQWERSVVLLNLETMRTVRLKGEDVRRARALIAQDPMYNQSLRIIDRPMEVLYRTLTVGDLELQHTEDPLHGTTRYPFFRYAPYWVDGYVASFVDNLKDPQRELNKGRSQTLHALNQTSSSGWEVDSISPEYEKILRRDGAKPGLILNKSKAPGAKKIEPNKLDQGHFLLSQQSGQDLKDISGANPDMMGTTTEQTESGRARLIRQQAGLTVIHSAFDNFQRTLRQVGRCVWDLIRRADVYSEEEIIAVVEEANLRQFVTQDAMGQPTVDLSAMKDWQNGRYGVRVGETSDTPTMRMEQFGQILDAIKAGLPIPPDIVVEMSDWPNKEEITSRMRQQMQQQQQQAGALPAGSA